MGLTESGPILQFAFVKPASFEWRDIVSLFKDMPCYVLISRSIIKLMY